MRVGAATDARQKLGGLAGVHDVPLINTADAARHGVMGFINEGLVFGPWAQTSGVYFLQAGKRGPVKIGVARNAGPRVQDLSTAHYEDLYLRLILETDLPEPVALRKAERILHYAFRRYRIRGEWFRIKNSSGHRVTSFMADPLKEKWSRVLIKIIAKATETSDPDDPFGPDSRVW